MDGSEGWGRGGAVVVWLAPKIAHVWHFLFSVSARLSGTVDGEVDQEDG